MDSNSMSDSDITLRSTDEVVREKRIMAEAGDATAQSLLGFCYENGVEVNQNYAVAVEWYRKAAEQGDALAQTSLGKCYQNGRGVPNDNSEAVKWYRKAAEQGSEDAKRYLINCHLNGWGVPKPQDDVEAAKWHRRMAELGGDANEFFYMGCLYLSGKGVPKDDVEAFKWYRKAVGLDHAAARNILGMAILSGWWQKVHREKYHGSIFGPDPHYYNEDNDIPGGIKLIRMAAEQGLADAQNNLGMLYLSGIGVPKDEEEGAKWIRIAAEQGLKKPYQWKRRFNYETEIDNDILNDEVERTYWVQLYAEQGDNVSQCEMGWLYRRGERGIPQNDAEAFKWYLKAAEQGDIHASFRVAECYRDGKGVPKNTDEAERWREFSKRDRWEYESFREPCPMILLSFPFYC